MVCASVTVPLIPPSSSSIGFLVVVAGPVTTTPADGSVDVPAGGDDERVGAVRDKR